MDSIAMLVNFGRQWKRVWSALEARGLVVFMPYARGGKHYDAFGEYGTGPCGKRRMKLKKEH